MSDVPHEVVVVGNVGIDTNVYFHGCPPSFERESSFTENLDCLGQAGGYAARAYAGLGRKTAFIGYVGDDHNGDLIRRELGGDGIDTAALFIDPRGTSRSVNFMEPDGRRKNFYDGKSHMGLEPDLARCRAVLKGARLAHFNIPNWARRLLPAAKEEGLALACDLQDVVSADDEYRVDFIEYADVLLFSAANHGDPAPLIRRFLQRRGDLIILAGMGAEGCALGTREGIRYFRPVPSDEPVVDTNGAGDTLAAGFLTSYVLEGRSAEEAILRGQICARHTCALKADSSRLITPEALEARVRDLARHGPADAWHLQVGSGEPDC